MCLDLFGLDLFSLGLLGLGLLGLGRSRRSGRILAVIVDRRTGDDDDFGRVGRFHDAMD